LIRIEGLTKYFDEHKAVDALSLAIGRGEVFGLLGPNGAGKSTTVRMLNTLSLPSEGEATINGFDIVKDAYKIKKIIGVACQELNLDKELTGRENLRIHGLMHRMKDMDRQIEVLLEWTELSDRADDLVQKYSGGMQRRLLIARAILHNPELIFLDEPTVGLDPQVRRQIWDLIRELRHKHVTVVLTTHYIEEAELLCDRIGILDHGRLIALGSPEDLKQQVGRFVVEVRNNGMTHYQLFGSREDACRHAEGLSRDILIRESNLEDVFVHLTGKRISPQRQRGTEK